MKSKKFKLNTTDLKAQLKSSVIWLVPLAVFYVAQLQGTLVDKKVLAWADFVPNESTVAAIQMYVVNQFYGLLQRLLAGK